MYKHPSITPRLPRQHYAPRLLPHICFEENGVLKEPFEDIDLGTIKKIGTNKEWDVLEVTLKDGTVVPCLRRSSPDNLYCVFQNMQYKIG